MQQPIVYFAGAIRGNIAHKHMMHAMVQYIRSLGHVVLTEHVIAENPIAALAAMIGKTADTITAEDIEHRDITWLDTATHVIAEISGASTGTGREIEYARTKGSLGKTPAKILCLYLKSEEWHASPMIRGMDQERYPNITVKYYESLEEAQKIIAQFLAV